MNINEHIEYWLHSSEHDLDVAISLFNTGKYDWALYIGHLVIEKILKAHFVKDNHNIPPRTHNLTMIANKIQIEFTEAQLNFLDRISRFNIEARYPDEKLQFYKICTKDFSDENFKQIMELYQWLKSELI